MKYKNITKKLSVLGCIFGTLFMGQACENDSVMYQEGNRIYFPTDSIYYSFGDKALNYVQHTVEFPVKVLGDASKEIRKFKISIDSRRTTAEAGKHYTALSTEYQVGIDSVNAIIPIVLNRAALEEGKEYRLVLKLEPNVDFELGTQESLTAVLAFSNILLEPKWWMFCEGYVGPFHPAKYQKFIEINGGALLDRYDAYTSYEMLYLSIFKQVKNYFDANPEPGIVFPDVTWPL